MARSPLLRQLNRLLARYQRAAVVAAQTGEPVQEAYERLLPLTRRSVLRAGALAAAMPLVEACGPGATAPGKSVVIVGGGMAGLHCAYRLFKDHGIRATVYEAQARLGGRMYTDRQTFQSLDGMHCELGGELVDTGHATMRSLATELQLDLLDYRGDVGVDALIAHFGGVRKRPAELLADWAPIAEKISADQDRITSDRYPTYRDAAGGADLDALNLRDYFDRLMPAGSFWRRLLGTAYVTEYGLELEQQSALNFLFLTGTATDELALFGESDERFHTRQGNDAFITRLAAALPPDSIRTGHVLTRVTKGSDGRYVCAFDADGGATEVKADQLVLTLPFSLLREVELRLDLPAVKTKAIQELGYGTNAKLMLGFDARPWRTSSNGAPGSNGESFTDLGYQCSWETSRLQSSVSNAGIITNFTGGQRGVEAGRGTVEERARDFLAGFDQVFPGSTAAWNQKAVRFHWPTHRWMKGSYQCYLPGQYTSLRGAEGESWENVHFCGEHTSLLNAGYMEGAAETGASAAQAVATALSVKTTTWRPRPRSSATV